MSLLQVTSISQEERGERILDNISFSIAPFMHTAIMGETGSGKTSLLKIMAGHVSPVSGEVFYNGGRLLRIPEEKLIQGHKGIAYLSQQSDLPGFLTISQVLEYANQLDQDAAGRIYEICRITHLLKRRSDQLSGGEKQRIAIARLLTTSPGLLLLDEPFSNLDTIHKAILKQVIHDVGEQLAITCCMIAHDPQDTLSWARQLIVLRNGKIIQEGTSNEIYYAPADEYVAALGGQYNLVPAASSKAFLALWGYSHRPAAIIVRPEQLLVSQDEYDPLFTVKELDFHGPFSMLRVEKDGLNLQVMTGNERPFKPGDLLRLHLPGSGFHILG